jgi:nicotinamide-nucleotide amidase
MSTLPQQVEALASLLKSRQWKITTAESCTGGGLAYALTSLSGSSQWFDRGFVTYDNDAKQEMLGIDPQQLQQFGEISGPIAKAMAENALLRSNGHVSIAITGIAGPLGGSVERPVGTVWISWAGTSFNTHTEHFLFLGDRFAIREQAIAESIKKMTQLLLM